MKILPLLMMHHPIRDRIRYLIESFFGGLKPEVRRDGESEYLKRYCFHVAIDKACQELSDRS